MTRKNPKMACFTPKGKKKLVCYTTKKKKMIIFIYLKVYKDYLIL